MIGLSALVLVVTNILVALPLVGLVTARRAARRRPPPPSPPTSSSRPWAAACSPSSRRASCRAVGDHRAHRDAHPLGHPERRGPPAAAPASCGARPAAGCWPLIGWSLLQSVGARPAAHAGPGARASCCSCSRSSSAGPSRCGLLLVAVLVAVRAGCTSCWRSCPSSSSSSGSASSPRCAGPTPWCGARSGARCCVLFLTAILASVVAQLLAHPVQPARRASGLAFLERQPRPGGRHLRRRRSASARPWGSCSPCRSWPRSSRCCTSTAGSAWRASTWPWRARWRTGGREPAAAARPPGRGGRRPRPPDRPAVGGRGADRPRLRRRPSRRLVERADPLGASSGCGELLDQARGRLAPGPAWSSASPWSSCSSCSRLLLAGPLRPRGRAAPARAPARCSGRRPHRRRAPCGRRAGGPRRARGTLAVQERFRAVARALEERVVARRAGPAAPPTRWPARPAPSCPAPARSLLRAAPRLRRRHLRRAARHRGRLPDLRRGGRRACARPGPDGPGVGACRCPPVGGGAVVSGTGPSGAGTARPGGLAPDRRRPPTGEHAHRRDGRVLVAAQPRPGRARRPARRARRRRRGAHGRPAAQGEPLDPDNPAPDGARAVAQVLRPAGRRGPYGDRPPRRRARRGRARHHGARPGRGPARPRPAARAARHRRRPRPRRAAAAGPAGARARAHPRRHVAEDVHRRPRLRRPRRRRGR